MQTETFTPATRVARCESGVAAHSPETADAWRKYRAFGKPPHFRSFGDLIGWIGYWAASGACSFGAVNSIEDMREARRWCPKLVDGGADKITDKEMFAALVEWRACRAEARRFA